MEKMKMQSENLVDENVEKIAKLFPNCVTEGKDENGNVVRAVDFDLLKQELSKDLVKGNDERYTLNWAGKKQSILTANSPINATLRPCEKESVGKDGTPGGWDSQNLYIEGDNLDVLKLLRETYLNKIKMIYIDPPYNTGNDFVYNDDFATSADEYLQNSKSYDEDGNRMVQNLESNGRFHSDWLSMMYPRLKLARDLLTEDGAIFISIDDNEQANLKKICDEIFGEQNFICQFIRKSGISPRLDAKYVSVENDLILFYARNINSLKINKMKMFNDDSYYYSDKHENRRGKYKLNKLDRGSISYSASMDYPIIAPDNSEIYPGGKKENNGWCWRWSKEKVEWGIKNDFIVIKKSNNGLWSVYFKQYQFVDNNDKPIERTIPYKNLLIDNYFNEFANKELNDLFGATYFDYPKPTNLIKVLSQILTEKNSIILDFFSGSATTAHAVMQLNAEDGGNRKFIMVQLPEITDEKSEAYKAGYKNICEIGKERIRRAGKKIRDDIMSGKILFQEKGKHDPKSEEFKKAMEIAVDNLENNRLDTIYLEEKKLPDIGFRVLKLDSSNMKDVYYSPGDTEQTNLLDLVSNIKEDRSPEDLLFQVMLDMGVMLSSDIKTLDIKGKKVFNVNDGNLVCCFDENLTDEVVTEIAKMQPLYAVFRDSSMSSDSVAVNFDQIFETYSPSTTRKVL